MKFQQKTWSCGPAAIGNALRSLGIKVPEAKLRKLSGATAKAGVGLHGVMHAYEQLQRGFEELRERRYAHAEALLLAHLRHGPAVVLTEEGDHWEAAIGLLDDRVIFADSQRYRFNIRENGIHVVQAGPALRRYWSPYGGKRLAILVKP